MTPPWREIRRATWVPHTPTARRTPRLHIGACVDAPISRKRFGGPVSVLNLGSVSQSIQPISCCSAANRSVSDRFPSQARRIWPEIQAWVSWLMARAPDGWSRNSIRASYLAWAFSRDEGNGLSTSTCTLRLDNDFVRQIDELLISRRSVDKCKDRESPRALERRQRMVPSVCTIIYPCIAGHPKSAELADVRHFVRAMRRNEHEITRAIDRNEGLRRMDVPLHLHCGKGERLRLDRRHRKSHARGRPAVLQLFDELLPSVPGRLGRNKLAER